jgi:tetratricopeptide (TPR) repeat protein
MRLRLMRFTVRRMMIAIAALAITLGASIEAVRLKRQRDEFLKRAAEEAKYESDDLQWERFLTESAESEESRSEQDKLARSAFKGSTGLSEKRSQILAVLEAQQSIWAAESRIETARQRDQAKLHASGAAYHAALKRKYERAAMSNWSSVEPDAPPPVLLDQARYWAERGQNARALGAFEEAIRLDPEDFMSLNELAWLLATCPDASIRDGKRAVELANRACELTAGGLGGFLDTLAASHAETGAFPAAVKVQNEAIGMLPPSDPNLQGFRARLALYQLNKPYRQGSEIR